MALRAQCGEARRAMACAHVNGRGPGGAGTGEGDSRRPGDRGSLRVCAAPLPPRAKRKESHPSSAACARRGRACCLALRPLWRQAGACGSSALRVWVT